MTDEARILKVQNTLAEVVRLPGGKTVAQALQGAADKIATVRAPTLAALRARIDGLGAVSQAGRSGSPDALAELYKAGNDILGLSGAVDAPGIAEAAYSLCELADAFGESGAANWAAIDVHLDALRILIVDDLEPSARSHILTGLSQVRERVL